MRSAKRRSIPCMAALAVLLVAVGCDRSRKPGPPRDKAQPTPEAPGVSVIPKKVAPTAPALDSAEKTAAGKELANTQAGGQSPVSGLGAVLASKLNVRRAPRVTKDNIVDVIHCGDIVALKEKANEWYKIQIDGTQGYSHGAFIEPLRAGSRRPLCEFIVRKPPKDSSLPLSAKKPERATNKDKLVKENPELAKQEAAPEPPAPVLTPTQPATAPVAQSVQARPQSAMPTLVALSQPPKSTAKQVSLTHEQHAKLYPCYRCHHPVSNEDGILKKLKTSEANIDNCHSCHGAGGKVTSRVSATQAFHTLCRDCHRVAGGKAPTGCPECHKQ